MNEEVDNKIEEYTNDELGHKIHKGEQDSYYNTIVTLRKQLYYLYELSNKVRTVSKNMVEYDEVEEQFKINNVITFSKEITDYRQGILLIREILKLDTISGLDYNNIINQDLCSKEDIMKDEDRYSELEMSETIGIGLPVIHYIDVKLFKGYNNIERICALLKFTYDIKFSIVGLKPHYNYIITKFQECIIYLLLELYRIRTTKNYITA